MPEYLPCFRCGRTSRALCAESLRSHYSECNPIRYECQVELKPVLRHNFIRLVSPWIRGAPHSGLARAIFLTRARICELTEGRPPCGCESRAQNNRKRLRCHLVTVSGCTIRRACRRPFHSRAIHTQNRRSLFRNRGRGVVRLRIANCCRRARFPKRSSRRS